MRVRITTGFSYHFPQVCACCGNAATTYLVIERTTTTFGGKRITSIQVPYCRDCKIHRGWHHHDFLIHAFMLAAFFVIIVDIMGVVRATAGMPNGNGILVRDVGGLVIGVLLTLVYSGLVFGYHWFRRRHRTPTCSSKGVAVGLSNDTIGFMNESYGAAFCKMNGLEPFVATPTSPYDATVHCYVRSIDTKKKYGPVPVHVVNQWIAQGRVRQGDYIKSWQSKKWVPIMDTPLRAGILEQLAKQQDNQQIIKSREPSPKLHY